MDWDKLKTFHFAAETGSLTAAAEKLGVSQSSVSRQIAALENDMGVPLFQRHARGLLLTGPGMALREFTREMAGAAVIAESTLKDAREKVIGDLKVTAPVAFGSTWLAPRLGAFADTYPETRLQIMLDDREYDLLKLEAECAIRLWAATHADLPDPPRERLSPEGAAPFVPLRKLRAVRVDPGGPSSVASISESA